MAGNNVKPKMPKFETLRSPKGIAGFSYLRDPDESFGACNHRVQIFVSKDDPEVKVFIGKLVETKKKYLASIKKKDDGKIPALKKADAYMVERFGEYGVKEGDLYFEFRSKARLNDDGTYRRVDVFGPDAKGAELRVFGGDIIRASVTLTGYTTGQGSGIKPYLNAVQVLEKKNNGNARANVFTDESAEHGAAEQAGAAAPFEAAETEGEAEETGGDIDLSDLI